MIKQNAEKAITIFSFLIAMFCLFNDAFFTSHDMDVLRIKYFFFYPYYLDFAFAGESVAVNGNNFVNAIFDVLLLIGSLVYVGSGFKKSKLLRFVYSVMLLSNLFLLINILMLYAHLHQIPYFSQYPVAVTIHYILYIFWILVPLKIIRFLGKNRQLQVQSINGSENDIYFVETNKGIRFIHAVVDYFIIIIIFSPLIRIILSFDRVLGDFYNNHSAGVDIIPYLSLLGLLYYLVSESILGLTPAKILTGARVINYNGERPSFKHIFIRTLSRIVPFEPFSFFADNGWHDKWSKTTVVNEKEATKSTHM